MAVNIGPKIGIDGEAEYRRQINNIIQQAKTLDSEMRAVAAAFTENTSAQDKNAAKSKILNQQIDVQKQRVEELSAMLAKSAEKYGENDTRTLKWKEAVNNANAELSKMENELRDGGEALDDNAKKAITFGDVIKANVISDAIMSGLRKMGDLIADAGRKLVDFAKEGVSLASDLEEVQNVIDVTFADGAGKIEQFSKNAASSFGISALTAKEFTGTLGAMFKSMGLGEDEVLNMSTSLAGLAGDMASFYNLDPTEAFNKLRSGISGETEPLKQLGINMSVANLEAYAMAQGIETAYNQMTQAEQATLRYNYIMQATADAQGDFSRTSDSYANQQRILQLNLENLSASVGQKILPVITRFTQAINAFISGQTDVSGFVATMTEGVRTALAGIEANLPAIISAGSKIVTALLEGVVTMLPEVAAAAVPLVMDLAEAIINNLPAIVNAGVTLIGELIGGIGQALPNLIPAAVEAIIAIANGLLNNVGMLLEAAMGLMQGLADGIMKALPELIEKVPEIVEKLVSVLTENVEIMLDAGIALILGLVDGLLKAIPELLQRIPEIIEKLVSGLIDNVGMLIDAAGELIRGLTDGLIKALPELVRYIPEIIEKLVTGLLDHLDELITAGIELIVALAVGLVEAIPELIASIPKIIKAIIDAFANTDWGEIGRNIIDGIGKGLTKFVSNLKDAVKRVANSVVDWAKNLLGISSPSKVFADEVGKMIPAGITVGIDKSMPKAIRDIQTQFSAIASVPVPAVAAAGGASTNYGGVTINVYGAAGQDVSALADIVMDRMQSAVRRKEAVFA